MLTDFLIGGAASAVVGLALWAFLPRGVVLARSVRTHDLRGKSVYDTWQLHNASPLPVRMTSAKVSGASTYNDETGKIGAEELMFDAYDRLDTSMSFDDPGTENGRFEKGATSWEGMVIAPGDTLGVSVGINKTLRIKYRRQGVFGVFEQRKVSIDGHV